LACPFFMPVEILEGGAWIHPARLPLGGGWSGLCQAPGHEGVQPSQEELHDSCNLGYAKCARIPDERAGDAVRFGIAFDRGSEVVLNYVLERSHAPVSHGMLSCNLLTRYWASNHPDQRIQKMAECFLQGYLVRRTPQAPAASVTS
jgi:hypothetical protein